MWRGFCRHVLQEDDYFVKDGLVEDLMEAFGIGCGGGCSKKPQTRTVMRKNMMMIQTVDALQSVTRSTETDWSTAYWDRKTLAMNLAPTHHWTWLLHFQDIRP